MITIFQSVGPVQLRVLSLHHQVSYSSADWLMPRVSRIYLDISEHWGVVVFYRENKSCVDGNFKHILQADNIEFLSF